MQKIFCFGELLLRISPEPNWAQSHAWHGFVGGAELNVALALVNWNIPTKIGTALPKNFVADDIIQFLAQKNTDISAIRRTGQRIGTYYLNQGADLKSDSVVYDRAYSSFSVLKKGDIDWYELLQGVHHLHFTAITPALSQNVADLCLEMLKIASAKNICISLDLNYRSKLWQYGKQPVEIIPELAKYCDIIMGNIWAANKMLGIELSNNVAEELNQAEWIALSKHSAQAIMQQLPKCHLVANTFRFNNSDDSIKYFASLHHKEKGTFFSKENRYNNIVDKAGSGDCFMAGLLYGIYTEKTLQQTIDFATAAATGKFYEQGDFTQQSIESIENKLKINNE